MSFALVRDKAFPDVPVEAGMTVVGDEGRRPMPPTSATSANTSKVLPSIKVENMLSEEEMSRLHELWNGAGLSARAQRRRRCGQSPSSRRIPAPISIPEPENTLPTLSSADPSVTGTTPLTTGMRKRWGFLSARRFPEKQEMENKVPKALETLRAKAQIRLKKKLRYAKSAPNLGDQGVPLEQGITLRPPMSTPAEATPQDVEARTLSSPGELATPDAVLQPEDMDENAIYFTVDPNWRASQGSAQFRFITPVPDSPTSLGRPDSPLLHRHHSLDQLSFAAQQAKTSATMEFPEYVYPSDEALCLIDELHTYPEF